MRSMPFAILVGLLIGLMSTAAAQQSPPDADTMASLPGIEIETSVDKAEAYIGDLITYSLIIRYDSVYALIPPPLGANLGAFDVKDYQPDVETELGEGRLQSQTTFVLSTFTTGDYTIPPLPVVFELSDKTRKMLLAEQIPIRILSLLGDSTGDSLDIKVLKPQYAFPRDYTFYYLWGGAVLLALALATGIWMYIRSRRKALEVVDNRPAWEKAFEQLAFLNQADLPSKGQHKEYYSELTEIARTYLGLMFKRDVLEMTTEEFLDEFQDIELPGQMFNQLSGFFKHADMVKFARYTPAGTRPKDDFEFAHRMIDDVRADYEARQQVETSVKTAAPTGATVAETEEPAS